MQQNIPLTGTGTVPPLTITWSTPAPITYDTPPCLLVQRVARLRAVNDLDQGFMTQCVSSHSFEQYVKGNQTETAVPHITSQQIRDFPIYLPPLSEQRKIAEILRTWGGVDCGDRGSVQSQASFIRYRSRRFFELCHPSLARHAGGWTKFVMGDLFSERVQEGSENDPLLSITMADGVIDRDGVGRKDSSSADKSQYKLVLPGDIGYNTMRMWQGVSGLSSLRGIVSPAYTVLIPNQDRIYPRYAAHLFKSRRMIHDFERYSQGLTSDTWNLKYPVFAEIKAFLPPIDLQERQANLLDAMVDEMSVINRQRDAFAAQKRGLMQRLLTGEWRVDGLRNEGREK